LASAFPTAGGRWSKASIRIALCYAALVRRSCFTPAASLGFHAMTTLAGRIRKARLRAGISQQQLAERLKVTRGAVANWEGANGVVPATERLQRIAQETGVSFEWLATGRGACKYEPLLDDIPGVIGMELVSDHLELRL